MRSKSRISFSGVSIITSQSGSANSHSQPYSRSLAANSYPLYPALCAAMVILSGSDSATGTPEPESRRFKSSTLHVKKFRESAKPSEIRLFAASNEDMTR